MTRRVWSLLAVLMSLALVIGACQAQPGGGPTATAAADAPDPSGELITNTGTEPDTIDPHKASFVGEIEQILSVFEGLMTLDPKTLKPLPAQAAKDPEVSADLKVWKFTLRDGLKWSDGSAVTAADFARGFTRTCDPATAGEYQFVLATIVGCDEWFHMDTKKETRAALDAAKAKLGIKALDAKTIEFTHKEAVPYFGSIAYMWVGMPVKQESLDKGGDNWTAPATYIGNGPFILKEHQKNVKFVYEPNPNYRLGAPKLKKWTRVMIAESAVAFAAYKANEIDVHGLSAPDLRAVDSDPTLKAQLLDLPYASSFYLGFNVTKAPFNDISVRQAFSKAFDREDYCKNVIRICQPAMAGFIPPGIPGYDETDTVQKFDPAAAKALLDKASPEARAALTSIKLTFSSTAVGKTRAEYQQANYDKHLPGVKITLDPVEPSAFSGLFKGGAGATSPQFFSLGWIADFPDQQNWHSTVWGGNATGVSSKRTGYKSAEFNRLTTSADAERDAKKRDDAYLQAGKILSQDAPAVWLYYGSTKRLVKPWVKGVTNSSIDASLGMFKMHEIYVTKKS
ncbi:MAG: peptide ABC transporter substrate-binding protein [Chloroflexi bacterium]|nr:peptide ABC transporter substrate-binding protein [Chloroflexota bacterium]